MPPVEPESEFGRYTSIVRDAPNNIDPQDFLDPMDALIEMPSEDQTSEPIITPEEVARRVNASHNAIMAARESGLTGYVSATDADLSHAQILYEEADLSHAQILYEEELLNDGRPEEPLTEANRPNRPARHRRSNGLRRTRAETQARQNEALRLRREGLALVDIAERLGFMPGGVPNAQSAAEAIRVAERREREAREIEVTNFESGWTIAVDPTVGTEYNTTLPNFVFNRNGVQQSSPRVVTVAGQGINPDREYILTNTYTTGTTPLTTGLTYVGHQSASNVALTSTPVAPAPRRVRRSPLARQAVTTTPPVSNRTFGIEVEFNGINRSTARAALVAAGLSCMEESYNHQVRNHWKIVHDASVSGTGLELVSPILQGADGLRDAMIAVDALLGAGARVDRSCGLHVHVGAARMTGLQIARVAELYTSNNDAIDTILAASRHDGASTYCRRHSRTTLTAAMNNLNGVVGHDAIRHAVTGLGSRYMTVNLTAYSRHGTIEFRQHQGTLNKEKVASWIKFVLALTEKATEDGFDTSTNLGSLSALMDTLEMDDQTKAFMNRRAASLARSR